LGTGMIDLMKVFKSELSNDKNGFDSIQGNLAFFNKKKDVNCNNNINDNNN